MGCNGRGAVGNVEDAEEQDGDKLLQLLASIARELSEAETLQDTAQRVVDLAERFLTNCHGASLMLISRRKIETPASSSQVAYDSDMAQFETDQGPCLDAIRKQQTIVVDDLEAEDRWPEYRAKALALGVRSMISFRLFMSEYTIGALDLYSKQVDAFDHRSKVLGQVFAAHASVALKAALTEAGLNTAIGSRDVIGQAKGIVMARRHMTADLAFDLLRDLSQRRNRPIRELAREIAEAGEVP